MTKDVQTTEGNEPQVDIQVAIQAAKDAIAEAKSEFKKFRKKHGIRTEEKIKDEKLLAEFQEHSAKLEALQEELDALNAKRPKGAGGRGGATLYGYGQVVDPTTKELRDPTKQETKRWRAKARRLAKEQGIAAKDIPFDPNFLIKPVKEKVEKPAKEKAEKVEKAEPADAPATEEAPRAKKKKVKADLD